MLLFLVWEPRKLTPPWRRGLGGIFKIETGTILAWPGISLTIHGCAGRNAGNLFPLLVPEDHFLIGSARTHHRKDIFIVGHHEVSYHRAIVIQRLSQYVHHL